MLRELFWFPLLLPLFFILPSIPQQDLLVPKRIQGESFLSTTTLILAKILQKVLQVVGKN